MAEMLLTPDDLLAGTTATLDVAIPHGVLYPSSQNMRDDAKEPIVRLRPITIGTFQLIMRASKSDAGLIPLLMIKESLVAPELSLDQIKQMHLGLVNFLIEQIREISGLTQKKSTSAT
jgi:hypothetical protein